MMNSTEVSRDGLCCGPAACSSALSALNDAMTELATGRVDYAVIGGACTILRPQASVAFQRLQMLSPEARAADPLLCSGLLPVAWM